jgi:hypothetical protein
VTRSRLAAIVVGLGLGLVPGAARAKSAPISSLPEGALPELASTRPARIEASEKVPAVAARREPRVGAASHVVLEADGESRACFQTFVNGAAVVGGGQDRIFAYPQGEILAARVEQIVVDRASDEARLELTDVFLDPRTLGVRAGAKAQLDLATVARGPGAARVYAFREKGGAIHVLVPTGSRGTFRDTKGTLGTSTCGHVHLGFAPDSPNAATVLATLEVAEPKPVTDPFARPKLAAPIAAMGGEAPKPPKPARLFQISVSVTKTSRDPEPLLAVSVGFPETEATPRLSQFGMGMLE